MATIHEEQPEQCAFCLNARSVLVNNARSRTGVRAARDGPEGGLSCRSRAPCAPATFAMYLGVIRAIKLGGAPRVAHSNDYSHHAWLLRRRQGLFFVICWCYCGIAPMLRWRQPTVVAPRPPPASFDATHPHGSLFYFHFSRRERAATQVVALACNGPLSTHNEKSEARAATASGGACRA